MIAHGNTKHQSLDNPIAVHGEKQLHRTDPQKITSDYEDVEYLFEVDCKSILDTEKDPHSGTYRNTKQAQRGA